VALTHVFHVAGEEVPEKLDNQIPKKKEKGAIEPKTKIYE